MKTLITISLLLMISCGGSKKSMQEKTKKETKEQFAQNNLATFETLIEAQMGGFETPQIRVIKEQQALQEVYGQINKTRKPGFSIPKIDFTKETIVAIFMGQKNTGGYAVKVLSAVNKTGEIVITVRETQPKPNAMVITALTQPFCVIKINSATKNIVFEKK